MRPFRSFPIALVRAAALVACTAAASRAAGTTGSIVAEAEQVYAQAAYLVAHTPSTSEAGQKLFNPTSGPYATFVETQERFGNHFSAAGQNLGLNVSSDLEGGLAFIGRAVLAAQSCDPKHARLAMHVAREYLDDAKAGAPAFRASNLPDAAPFPPDLATVTAALEHDAACPPPRS